MRGSTGKSIVAAKRKAILPGVSNMSSQHATLLGSRQKINVRQSQITRASFAVRIKYTSFALPG